MTRHCLGCGRRQSRWLCPPCDGKPDRRPWALREGWAQDVAEFVVLTWARLWGQR